MFKGTAEYSWVVGIRECRRGEEDGRQREDGRRGRLGIQSRIQRLHEQDGGDCTISRILPREAGDTIRPWTTPRHSGFPIPFVPGTGSTTANVTREKVPALSSPPTEKAHSDDSNSGLQDLDNLPGPSGTTGHPVTQAQSHTTTEPPPSGTNTTAPTQSTHTSVPRTRQSAVCPPLQGPQATPRTQDYQGPGVSGSRHTVQGTEAQATSDTGRTAVRQGEDRTRRLTLHEELAVILGAYQHSQDTMGQILDNVQKNWRLIEGQYQGIREDLQAINNILISIAGVLADMANFMRKAVSHQRAPATSLTYEKPSTSAAASGQEALSQDS
ncbi:hypothetical protein NDU88_001753 [Pleurodeles waltl]|uniref:Uncharacterized protein n=1 Tax=Pleurodeles waltl TaxID=8319 RepID=A0AAV7P809_PLEWA|nr:hypothetical protein NDU88_001753 [Pleurodeles waltl]